MENLTVKRKIFLLGLLAWISSVCIAQLPDYHVQLLDESNNIQTASIRQMIRDKEGFIWLLSARFVERFDGKNTLRFYLPGEELLDILVDSSNRIWVSSHHKLRVFVNDYTGFREIAHEGKSTTFFREMALTPDKRVWAISNKGLFVLEEAAMTFRSIQVPGMVSTNFVRTTLQVNGEHLFFATYDSVFAWNIRTNSVRRVANIGNRYLIVLNKDVVWGIKSEYGIDQINMSNDSVKPLLASQFNPLPATLFSFVLAYPLSEHEYIIVTSLDYYRYNDQTEVFTKINLYHGGVPLVEWKYIYTGYIDASKNLWSVSDAGITFFPLFGAQIGWLRKFGKEKFDYHVRAITEDQKGNIWLATSQGFSVLNPNTGFVKNYLPGNRPGDLFTYPSVRGFVYDGKNLIIGPTDGGPVLFDPKTEKYKRPIYPTGKSADSIFRELRNEFITSINTLRNGNHLVLGQRGAYLIYGKDYRMEALKFPGSRFNLQWAVENRKGQIYFASARGVVLVDSGFHTLQMDTVFPENPVIRTLFLKNDSTVWAANFGIFEIVFGKTGVRKGIIISELQNHIIAFIYRDRLGKIWIGTDNGIYRYTEKSKRLEWFDYWDNVQNKMFNPNSILRTTNGALYIGGFSGLNYFVPEKITPNTEKLSVLVSNVRINVQDDSSFFIKEKPLQLRYRQNSVELQFAVPYFNNPKKVQFRYLLQGLDTGWVYIGRNPLVRFSSLAAGNYTFFASASLDGQNWFTSRQPFSFTISPPFWKTWSFRFLVLLVLIGIGLLLLENYKKRTERKNMQQMIDYFANSGYEHAAVDDILWDITRNCVSRLNFEDCVIYMLDDKRKVLVQRAAFGLKNPKEKEIYNPLEIPLGIGIVGTVAATGKAEIIADTSKDKRYIVDDKRRMSEITIPILNEEKVLGVIDSEHQRRNFYTKRHLQVLQSIAAICSSKIARVMAEQETLEKEQRMKELNQQMKENRLAALQAQMNPHFIFNAMNSIQQFTLQNDVDNANKYLSRFSKLLREVLHQSQKNTVTLAEEIELLQLYLQIESLRMNNDFEFRIDVEGDIETDAIKIPVMIIQPFVENALVHGLSAKRGAKELVIKFRMKNENVLVCEVRDNGIGREKAKEFRLQKKGLLKHESRGMQMVKERLQLFNGTDDENSHINIVDLKDEKGENAGTLVIIEIPV